MQPYIDNQLCENCGDCVTICPYDVFADEAGHVVVANPEECIECSACMDQCPAKAIYMVD